jgi:hypothetical protein
MEKLPKEIFLILLSFLNCRDLSKTKSVCKYWLVCSKETLKKLNSVFVFQRSDGGPAKMIHNSFSISDFKEMIQNSILHRQISWDIQYKNVYLKIDHVLRQKNTFIDSYRCIRITSVGSLNLWIELEYQRLPQNNPARIEFDLCNVLIQYRNGTPYEINLFNMFTFSIENLNWIHHVASRIHKDVAIKIFPELQISMYLNSIENVLSKSDQLIIANTANKVVSNGLQIWKQLLPKEQKSALK